MGQAPQGAAYNETGNGWPLIAGAGDFKDGKIAPKKYTTVAPKLSQVDDIVLSIRASIGAKVWSDGEYCLGRGVAALSPKEGLDRAYLWHWLSANEAALRSKGRGATFLQVSKADIAELPIAPPPLPEQRRIASILDEVDDLRASRSHGLNKARALSSAIFIEAFGDPIQNPMQWPTKPLRDLGAVVTGNTPSRTNKSNFGGDLEWIKSDNIDPGEIYVSVAEETLGEVARPKARVVKAGSVLVTCIAGSPNSIGNAALTDREVSFNQQINAFVPTALGSRYALEHFRIGKVLVQNQSSGGMKGLVSKGRFEQIEFMAPPMELQHEFATASQLADEVCGRQAEHLAALDELLVSLQHRAFRGEL
jgi:type I restriction enzyme S subunit